MHKLAHGVISSKRLRNKWFVVIVKLQFNIQQMGQVCGVDIFQRLISEYGESFAKLIALENSKPVVKEQVSKIKTQLAPVFTDFKATADTKLNESEQKLHTTYQEMKEEVLQRYPSLKATLEFSGKNIDDLVDAKSIFKKVEEAKVETRNQIEQKQSSIFQDIDHQQENLLKQIEESKPRIPLYSDLPEEARKEVDAKALETFKDKIKEQKDLVRNQVQTACGVDKIKEQLKEFDPTGKFGQEVDGQIEAIKQKVDETANGSFNVGGFKIGF